ncbi:MAG: hypothetical protein ACP5F3_07095, partial [Candidatus Syntrophosphaera sp.]
FDKVLHSSYSSVSQGIKGLSPGFSVDFLQLLAFLDGKKLDKSSLFAISPPLSSRSQDSHQRGISQIRLMDRRSLA